MSSDYIFYFSNVKKNVKLSFYDNIDLESLVITKNNKELARNIESYAEIITSIKFRFDGATGVNGAEQESRRWWTKNTHYNPEKKLLELVKKIIEEKGGDK